MSSHYRKRDYKFITADQRETIIKGIEKEKQSFNQIARSLGIKTCTCKAVYRIYKNEGRKIKLIRRDKIKLESIYNISFVEETTQKQSQAFVVKQLGEIFSERDSKNIEQDNDIQKHLKKKFFELLFEIQCQSQKVINENQNHSEQQEQKKILINLQQSLQTLTKKFNENQKNQTHDQIQKNDNLLVETDSIQKQKRIEEHINPDCMIKVEENDVCNEIKPQQNQNSNNMILSSPSQFSKANVINCQTPFYGKNHLIPQTSNLNFVNNQTLGWGQFLVPQFSQIQGFIQNQSLNQCQQVPLKNHQFCQQITKQIQSQQQNVDNTTQLDLIVRMFQDFKRKQNFNHGCEDQLIQLIIRFFPKIDQMCSQQKIQQLYALVNQLEQIENIRHQSNVQFLKNLFQTNGKQTEHQMSVQNQQQSSK